MEKNDDRLIAAEDFPLALSLLSRLPVPVQASNRSARAAWAYPLVGLVIGALAGLLGLFALWLGLPALLAALVILGASTVLTGAIHEDGLADTADGLWGGWTAKDRLAIMKDSHIGTYGVIALILSFAARGAALWMLLENGAAGAFYAVLAGAVLSRASMPALMAALPQARDTGLSHAVGRVSRQSAALAAGLASVVALFLLGGAFVGAIIWVGLAALLIGVIAHAKIGGQTGDILGASQQVTEIAVLCFLLS